MNHVNWYAVSISKVDGHNINGKFITNSQQTLNAFAKAAHPKLVSMTTFNNKEEAKKLLNELHESYLLIEPNDYINLDLIRNLSDEQFEHLASFSYGSVTKRDDLIDAWLDMGAEEWDVKTYTRAASVVSILNDTEIEFCVFFDDHKMIIALGKYY